LRELLLPHAVGQEAEVPQPMEAVRRDMQHEPPQECHGIKRQSAQAVAALVVLRAEGHLATLQGHEPMVRDGHPMGITGQGGEDVLGLLERGLGVDHPFLAAHVGEELVPRLGLNKPLTASGQGQLALAIEVLQACQVQSPKAPREDADGQEEVWPTRGPLGPVERQAPCGEDAMEMRVMVELLAPGVEHGEAADLCPEMLRVRGDVLERLGDRAKE